MVDNQIQSLVQTAISIADAQLKKVQSEIKEEVRGVALQWSQISVPMTKWAILPDPQEIVWSGRCWNFIPIEIQFPKAHSIQTRMEFSFAPLPVRSHSDIQVQSLQARLQKVEFDRLPPFSLLDCERKFTQLDEFNKVKTNLQNLVSELQELIKEESCLL